MGYDVRNEMDVHKDGIKKSRHSLHSRQSNTDCTSWPRYGFVVGVVSLVQSPDWLLPFAAGGILVWAAGSVALLSALALLFLWVRRHRRPAFSPPPINTVPFLESPDGDLYFRLEGLDGDGVVIGRGKHGVDLQIELSIPHADTVSNRHARIYYDASCGYVIIEDLNSTNGVFINDRQAPRKNLLKDGWVISLGKLSLTYHDGESDTGPLD